MYLKDNMCTDNRRRTTSAEKKQNEKIEQFQRYHRHTHTHTQANTCTHPNSLPKQYTQKIQEEKEYHKNKKKKDKHSSKETHRIKKKEKSMKNKNSIGTKTIRPKNLLNNEQ